MIEIKHESVFMKSRVKFQKNKKQKTKIRASKAISQRANNVTICNQEAYKTLLCQHLESKVLEKFG